VRVTDASQREAVTLMESLILARDGCPRAAFIVNAHSLNLAWEDPSYAAVLNGADVVFGDGTGVRLAARAQGVRLRDNLVGTDLLPLFFRSTLERGLRYFLLGGAPGIAAHAAARLEHDVPGICIAGHRHGYFRPGEEEQAIAQINDAAPDLLLVGMGNPTQERWIHANLSALRVPLSIGVGGLFDHWAGQLHRAPLWVRRLGIEWVQILLQQSRTSGGAISSATRASCGGCCSMTAAGGGAAGR
jgi:N-acetylglucosaminyldiphosphoundecaprenol N-acetyl-beta-D-mannosaminyltransferase